MTNQQLNPGRFSYRQSSQAGLAVRTGCQNVVVRNLRALCSNRCRVTSLLDEVAISSLSKADR